MLRDDSHRDEKSYPLFYYLKRNEFDLIKKKLNELRQSNLAIDEVTKVQL